MNKKILMATCSVTFLDRFSMSAAEEAEEEEEEEAGAVGEEEEEADFDCSIDARSFFSCSNTSTLILTIVLSALLAFN